ncbi:hypothetical protein LCGC14_2885660, partial [marine sediment metagenome]
LIVRRPIAIGVRSVVFDCLIKEVVRFEHRPVIEPGQLTLSSSAVTKNRNHFIKDLENIYKLGEPTAIIFSK